MKDTERLEWYFAQRKYKVSPTDGARGDNYYLHDTKSRRYSDLIGTFYTPQDAIDAAMETERDADSEK